MTGLTLGASLRQHCYEASALCETWAEVADKIGMPYREGDTAAQAWPAGIPLRRRYAIDAEEPWPHPDSRVRGRGRPRKDTQTLPDRLPDAVSGQTEQTKPPRSDQAVPDMETAHGGEPALPEPEKKPIQVEMERRERVAGGWDALGQKRRRGMSKCRQCDGWRPSTLTQTIKSRHGLHGPVRPPESAAGRHGVSP